MLALAIAAFAAFAPSASADITNTGPSAATGSVTLADPTPGAHSDLTFVQNYTQAVTLLGSAYSGVPSGAAGNSGDDLKQWVLDTPAGLFGNPNAIPFAERCTAAQKANYVPNTALPSGSNACPASAQVGTAEIVLGLDASSATMATYTGKIFLMQPEAPVTEEVPASLFSVIDNGGGGVVSVSTIKFAPVTSGPEGDFRLRAVSDANMNRPILAAGPTYGNLKRITYNLEGYAPNGNPFQTNPSRCGDWKSTLYAASYGTGQGAGVGGGTANQTTVLTGTAANAGDTTTNTFLTIDAGTISVPCPSTVPLKTTASASITTGERGANPGLTVTVSDPTPIGDDQPQKTVTTLPASITNDVDSLVKVCSTAERDAEACPADTQIGTATVKTPLISAGLTGKVYKTKGETSNLPNLSIFVDGAIKFRLDATNEFVGASFNQIRSTFNNLPQVPFSEFVVTINGGTADSLLQNRKCPTDGTAPEDGPITFSIDGWTGANNAASSDVKFDGCYGVDRPASRSHCLRANRRATFRPRGLINRPNIKRVQLMTGRSTKHMRSRASRSKSPFTLKRTLNRRLYPRGHRFRFGYRVTYNDGHIIRSKTATFRVCR
jgi:hypothetical protein